MNCYGLAWSFLVLDKNAVVISSASTEQLMWGMGQGLNRYCKAKQELTFVKLPAAVKITLVWVSLGNTALKTCKPECKNVNPLLM